MSNQHLFLFQCFLFQNVYNLRFTSTILFTFSYWTWQFFTFIYFVYLFNKRLFSLLRFTLKIIVILKLLPGQFIHNCLLSTGNGKVKSSLVINSEHFSSSVFGCITLKIPSAEITVGLSKCYHPTITILSNQQKPLKLAEGKEELTIPCLLATSTVWLRAFRTIANRWTRRRFPSITATWIGLRALDLDPLIKDSSAKLRFSSL